MPTALQFAMLYKDLSDREYNASADNSKSTLECGWHLGQADRAMKISKKLEEIDAERSDGVRGLAERRETRSR